MLVQCSPTPLLSGKGPLASYISHPKAQQNELARV